MGADKRAASLMFVLSRIGSRRTVDRRLIRYYNASNASFAKSGEQARVVVVGSGRMGQIRAQLIYSNPRLQLSGIVDTDASKGQVLAEKFGVQSFQSLSNAVDGRSKSEPLNGCVICTSTHSHAPLIREAADHRFSIFVEKPVAENAQVIEQLFSFCASAGVDLCCGFQRRFDPSYVAACRAVQMGEIGAPVAARLFFADHPVPPREFLLSGGNIFMDLLAHDVDYILNALQDQVSSVYAVASSSDEELGAAGVHDSANVMLITQKGMLQRGIVCSSRGHRFHCHLKPVLCRPRAHSLP